MIKQRFNIVACASCGGGLFKTLLDNSNIVGYQVSKLIVNKDCGAVEFAKQNGIDVVTIPAKNNENFAKEFISEIPFDTDLIVLVGYLPIIPQEVCELYHRKIINVHPSLLPKYGGKGMYGVKVQEAVMANKEEYGGCTIHFVSQDVDKGKIILQKEIKVDYNLTPWQFGGKVYDISTVVLIEAIELLMKERNYAQ